LDGFKSDHIEPLREGLKTKISESLPHLGNISDLDNPLRTLGEPSREVIGSTGSHIPAGLPPTIEEAASVATPVIEYITNFMGLV
jgi:hypothetical protein